MELDWHVISLKPLPKWKQSSSFLSPLCSQDTIDDSASEQKA